MGQHHDLGLDAPRASGHWANVVVACSYVAVASPRTVRAEEPVYVLTTSVMLNDRAGSIGSTENSEIGDLHS